MAGEPNQVKWRGIRPTDPPENIPVTPAAGSTIKVYQDVPANLKAANYPVARGIYPNPPDAVRVNEFKYAWNSTSILYEVDDGKVLFISAAWEAGANQAVGWDGGFYVEVVDAGDVFKILLLQMIINGGTCSNTKMEFNPAVEVPAGWKVTVRSRTADLICYGAIFGWIEDV